LDTEIDAIAAANDNSNKQIQALAQEIDDAILTNYKLWPTNYIAYDIVNKTNKYAHLYTENEKLLFERRLEMRIDHDNPIALDGFLAMYANPVVNKLKYEDVI
jgi:ABC-type arginine transport system ATPase subunit